MRLEYFTSKHFKYVLCFTTSLVEYYSLLYNKFNDNTGILRKNCVNSNISKNISVLAINHVILLDTV